MFKLNYMLHLGNKATKSSLFKIITYVEYSDTGPWRRA